MNTIIGTKLAMDQTWDKNGRRIPVTVVAASPMVVTQVKSNDTDGYNAIQVGIGTKRGKNISKPQLNHLKKKLKDSVPTHIQEIRTPNEPQHKVGDTISPSEVLNQGDIVSVTGTSKGRGFSGVMKRWGFHGGPRTHGQSDRQRAPGSIGQGTDPGRVHKGKKMPGRFGNQQFTIKNLSIVNIDEKQQTIWLSGPIPGTKGTLIIITKKDSKDFPGLYYSQNGQDQDQTEPETGKDTETPPAKEAKESSASDKSDTSQTKEPLKDKDKADAKDKETKEASDKKPEKPTKETKPESKDEPEADKKKDKQIDKKADKKD